VSSTKKRDFSVVIYLLPLVIILTSFAVMTGWIIENKAIIQLQPDMSPMVFNTALSFFFLSIGLGVSQLQPSWLRKACAAIPFAIAVVTLLQYITGFNLGIDSFFFKPFYDIGVTSPGRMAISTASCFLLLSTSLFIFDKRFWSQYIVTTLCSLVTGFAGMGILGYFFRFNSEYGWGSFSRMALHTALCFVLVALCMILFVLRNFRQRREPTRNYLPFYVVVTGILFTVTIWAMLLLKDVERSRGVMQLHAESVKTELDNAFFPLHKALDHMAKRFAFKRYDSFKMWEIDAQSYFDDFAGLRRLMWAGPDNKVRWVYPSTAEGLKNIGLNLSLTPSLTRALNKVAHTHKSSMTDSFEISPGERGFVLIIPIIKDQVLQGTLSVVVMVSSFLGPLEGFQGYDLAIFEDGIRILSTGGGEPVFARDWSVETKYQNFGTNWEVRLIPAQDVVRSNTSLLPGVVLVFGLSISFLLGIAVRFYTSARESELRAQEALAWQRASVNSIPLLFVSVSSEGVIREMNQEAERLLEYSKESLITKSSQPQIWLDPRELLEKSLQLSQELGRTVSTGFECLVALIEGKQKSASEWTIISRTGKRYSTVLSISPIQMSTAEHSGYLLVFEDITVIKEREQLLKEQEAKILTSARLASLGEMAAGIAHEINNPLAIINGHVGVLRRQIGTPTPANDEILRKLSAIESTVQRIAKIIRGLRSYARESDLSSTETFTVESVVDDTLSFCIEKFKNNGVTLTAKLEPGLHIHGRPTQVSQVLLNLLNNAYDAVSQSHTKEVWVEAKRKDNGVELSVSDSGPGVPIHLRAKVMEPFFTTKEVGKGVGLGLSISSGIVQAHNGRFYLDDKSLKTRFVVWLPS
jgi:two-component system sensor histidine kinase DctS